MLPAEKTIDRTDFAQFVALNYKTVIKIAANAPIGSHFLLASF
jgi:hypothetical protein